MAAAMLFDSHAHLDAPEFDGDRAATLARARAAGVHDLLIPAIDARSWPTLRALCVGNAGLHPAYGLHPLYIDRHADADLAALRNWIAQSDDACAIGECGLDFHDPALDRERQLRFLRAHFQLAREHGLPLVLHARGAFEPIILELRRFGAPLRGVVHSFSGSAEQARRLWQLGFLIGIGGPVTYERARRLRRLVAEMPIEFLLLETDAPDQPDSAWRGRRNEPARLVAIRDCVAALRGATPDSVAVATAANAHRLFQFASPG